VKTGVQCFCNALKSLASGFHRNDDSWAFSTFYEVVKLDADLCSPLGHDGLLQGDILVDTAARQGKDFLAAIDVLHAEDLLFPFK